MIDYDSDIYDVEEIQPQKSIWRKIYETVTEDAPRWFAEYWGFLFLLPIAALLLFIVLSAITDTVKTDLGPFTVIDNNNTYTNLTYKNGRYYDSSNTYRFSDRATIIKLTSPQN